MTTYLGEFEYAVLLAVLRLADEAYAVPVRELIETRTGRAIARGALYTALERLETKGCLKSTMKQADAPRAGRARRYFALTPSGVAASLIGSAHCDNDARLGLAPGLDDDQQS